MKKQSGFGIVSLVIGILSTLLSCTGVGLIGILGVIFSIIGIAQKDKKDGIPIAGLVLSIIAVITSLVFIAFILGATEGTSDDTGNVNALTNTESSADTEKGDNKKKEEESKNEEGKENDDDELTVGSSFEKRGLKITVNEADLDFSDYSDEYGFYEPADGMKYIMVSFTFENNGNSDFYVSIYDFNCYADNTSCEQVYLPDDNEFMFTNLSKGRNISFQTYYQVPKEAETIELEYETSFWKGEKAVIKLK